VGTISSTYTASDEPSLISKGSVLDSQREQAGRQCPVRLVMAVTASQAAYTGVGELLSQAETGAFVWCIRT
jgi:hypothetical protein